MRLRPILILVLLVLISIGAVVALAVQVAHQDRTSRKQQFQSLVQGRLGDVKNAVGQGLDEIERHLLEEMAASPPGPDVLRAALRKEPFARQFFVVDGDGRLVFPPDDDTTSAEERAFRERTAPIWEQRAVLYNPPGGEANPADQQKSGPGDSVVTLARHRPQGWITWYWEEGLHLLFWRRAEGGGVVGVEVERIALLARIVGRMPTTELPDGRIVLRDSRGDTIYQWGPYRVGAGERPVTSLTLGYPLDAWQLDYYASPAQRQAFLGSRLRLDLLLGVAAIAIALLGMAVYVYREYSRRLRDAAQRVNFVTQVSHELKTPLANIRLYAELLADEIDDEDEGEDAGRRLGVIVAESQRLTRLINNILAFSKHSRSTLQVSPVAVAVDRIIESTVGQFRPALSARGVECRLSLGAPAPVLADADAVGQIVANLISNVEKYGASGGVLEIESSQDDGQTTVTVTDRGPGVPRAHHDKIFAPFYRVSDKLTDGVTGTGIGLAISRELARQNGGELELVASERGACFRLTLPNHREADDEGTGS